MWKSLASRFRRKRVGEPVDTLASYAESFPPQIRAEALKQALDIRKFEIELYWKRTAYFWTLIGAAIAGYAALRVGTYRQDGKDANGRVLLFLLSCFGMVLSCGWYMANRASKYWQENWERHVDALEDLQMGPLYRTTIAHSKYRLRNLTKGYPFSVSRINQQISLFVIGIWFLLAVEASSLDLRWVSRLQRDPALFNNVIGIVTLVALVMLAMNGRPRSEGEPREVTFTKSALIGVAHEPQPAEENVTEIPLGTRSGDERPVELETESLPMTFEQKLTLLKLMLGAGFLFASGADWAIRRIRGK
jgi:hypothetical protein